MTPFASSAEIRPAVPGDLPRLAAFIARLNALPASQSLYCAAGSAAGVRGALRDAENFPGGWEGAFVVATGPDGGMAAAAGCQFDPAGTPGWLWGPWVDGPANAWPTLAARLLDGLFALLPVTLPRLEAFLNAENRAGLRLLAERGFTSGILTHIYVLPRAAWQKTEGTAETGVRPLRAAHEVAFARLHAETFPTGASAPADDLLAGRGDERAILTVTDGLRLLGYVCVSVNHAPREGFIDYLAVKPTARGRGIGARLLGGALHWIFDERQLPQAALCVSEWRGGARRLYESAGFVLGASGVGMRRNLPVR